MITVYHNATCSKSKAVLEALHNAGIPFEMVEYLHNPPTPALLKEIFGKMKGTEIKDLNRNPEYLAENHSPEEVFQYLSENPEYLQRPILVDENFAAIARTPEEIQDFIQQIQQG